MEIPALLSEAGRHLFLESGSTKSLWGDGKVSFPPRRGNLGRFAFRFNLLSLFFPRVGFLNCTSMIFTIWFHRLFFLHDLIFKNHIQRGKRWGRGQLIDWISLPYISYTCINGRRGALATRQATTGPLTFQRVDGVIFCIF